MKTPFSVASIIPSSQDLGRAMASTLPSSEGTVLELGAGTGAITRSLLAKGFTPDQLIIVERDPQFCDYLRRNFRGVRVLLGDASCLEELLNEADITLPVQAVFSGLPLVLMEPDIQARIIGQSLKVTGGQGPFIQFSYHLRSPLDPSVRQQLGITEGCMGRVWRNFPPAKVWQYQCGTNFVPSGTHTDFLTAA